MPKASNTDFPTDSGPSALEMFTDRVSEQELLTRLLAPHQQGEIVNPKDFLTTFYGVGGVGKTTLCNQVTTTCKVAYPEVAIARLNLDSDIWTLQTSFAELLAALLHELSGQKISCPLTQALLPMYHQASTAVRQAGAATGLRSAALSAIDQATQAVGVPGIGLVIQWAQWLREHRKQLDTRRRLEDLKLWPKDDGGQIDRLDLEDKLVKALYEDLKFWSLEKKDLRILFDGFERIQGRERKRDCQMLLQKFAGYIAAESVAELYAQIRIFIFSRDILRWDELYDDDDWKNYWTQHLLAGLGEDDAKEFLKKHADWLRTHGDPTHADILDDSTEAILDAADERVGTQRLIYPYYLDLAVTLIRQAAYAGRKPDLGKTPGELQDRFFRYLPPQELHLLKILALAKEFDASMFDALVRDHRVSNYSVGTFSSAVVHGRSYVSEINPGFFRFHRMMQDSLQNVCMKSEVEKEQGREVVRWLLVYYATPLLAVRESDWTDSEVEKWRRGMEILVSHGLESNLLPIDEWKKLSKNLPWLTEQILDYTVNFTYRILKALEQIHGPNDSETLSYKDKYAAILLERMNLRESENLFRETLSARSRILGPFHEDTLASLMVLAWVLVDMGDHEKASSLYSETLISVEAAMGISHPKTLFLVVQYLQLLKEVGEHVEAQILRKRILDDLDSLGWLNEPISETPESIKSITSIAWILNDNEDFKKAEVLYRKALSHAENSNDKDLSVVSNLSLCIGVILSNMRDIDGAIEFSLKAVAAGEEAFGENHPETLKCVSELAALLEEKKDFKKAEEYHKRALQGSEKAYGAESSSKITYANRLGNFYMDIGRYEEAKLIYQNCIDILEKKLVPEAPFTLGLIFNLGLVFQKMGNLSEAEIQYRKSFKGQEKILGLTHDDTLMSLERLAYFLKEKGDFDESLKSFNTLLETKSQKDPGFSNTWESHHILKEIITLRDYPWAIGYVDGGVCSPLSMLINAEIKHTCDSPEFEESLMNMGCKMKNKGDYLHAEGFYRRAFEIRSRRLGPDHHLTLTSAEYIGYILREREEFEELESLYRYQFESHKKTFGEFHQNAIYSLGRLGTLLEERGSYEEAKLLYFRVIPVIEEELKGSDNYCPSALFSSRSIVEGKLIPLMRKIGELEEAELLLTRISEYSEEYKIKMSSAMAAFKKDWDEAERNRKMEVSPESQKMD